MKKDWLADFEQRSTDRLKEAAERDRKWRQTERRWEFLVISLGFVVWIMWAAVTAFVLWAIIGILNHFGVTDVNLPGLA